MRSIVNRAVVLIVVGTLTCVLAFGKTTKREITFVRDVSVNDTLVKKGTYKVTFDDETGELTIKKGGKLVATAQARVEQTNNRSGFYQESASADPAAKAPALVSVYLKDGNLATIVNSGASARQ